MFWNSRFTMDLMCLQGKIAAIDHHYLSIITVPASVVTLNNLWNESRTASRATGTFQLDNRTISSPCRQFTLIQRQCLNLTNLYFVITYGGFKTNIKKRRANRWDAVQHMETDENSLAVSR